MCEWHVDGRRVSSSIDVVGRAVAVLPLVAVLWCAAGIAAGQPCQWLAGGDMPGANGLVMAATTWDPDGAGPQPEVLVFAETVSGVRIATWDGATRQYLGGGLGGGNFLTFVYALTVYNGEVIVGGNFTDADGVTCNRVARWDGSSWQPLGSGIDGWGADPYVYALAVYNGELIAGGDFQWAGGEWCENIARWNGSEWQPMGYMSSPVMALAVYNGELIANGYHWTGSDWQPLGSGMDGPVMALSVYNGELIAGGECTTVGGVACNGIARWDGSAWEPLGSGVSGGYGMVRALAVYSGELIAGGYFTMAGGVECSGIARWDGSVWQALGSELGAYEPDADVIVYSLMVYNGELIAGGNFATAGGAVCEHIACWDGSGWHVPWSGWGLSGNYDPRVQALAVYDGELIAGGDFDFAGDVPCSSVARWNGSAWQPMGSGTSWVVALLAYDGDLIAGADFEDTGVARWDGSTWQAMGSGMSADALTVYNGELIAGNIDGDISRWDGSAWQPLWSAPYDYIYALTVYDGDLIAGGLFRPADDWDYNVARWDGSTWEPMGSWFTNAVYALAVYNGELIANDHRWDGSSWQPMGAGLGVGALIVYNGELLAGSGWDDGVYRWAGTDWQRLGEEFDGDVRALTSYNGELVAGGFFTRVGGMPSYLLARWACAWDSGDLNCDGVVDAFDIDPFVLALTSAEDYAAAWPDCDYTLADVNDDGSVNAFDIDPFVRLLTGQ